MNENGLLQQVNKCRYKADKFLSQLVVGNGAKYTVNHDAVQFPAALLYGSWSVLLGKNLLNKLLTPEEDKSLVNTLLKHRNIDGTFFPEVLLTQKPAKSFEYLKLHCSNYAIGALMELDPAFDFQSSYFDQFLNADFLKRWLDQRAFNRPWEESNNIVNVASYLALCNDHGDARGKERLYDMLEWHSQYQNPKTGGFDNFSHNGYKNSLQSMAGAVHNFHIHLYLNEPFRYEALIAENVTRFLFEGPLTACLSIDFVELGIRTLPFVANKEPLVSALLYHLESLLKYQNKDGGWYENDSRSKPTTAAGMKEKAASSCSYATWFRLCSIGMIAIVLLGDNQDNWKFRKTLGMGYAPDYWPESIENELLKVNIKVKKTYQIKNLPEKMKKEAIQLGIKLLRC